MINTFDIQEEIQELPLRKIREWDIHENGGTLVWIPDGRTVHFVQFKSKGQVWIESTQGKYLLNVRRERKSWIA